MGPLSSPISRDDIAQLAAREDLALGDDARIGVLLADRSIDVQACPGSGKTTLIAAKLMLLAHKWQAEDRGVCVLSHTNVAKNEIVERLSSAKTVAARRLLSYPHFVGTIQEFVDRYLALPYLRSTGAGEVTVDNDEYLRVARTVLSWNQFAWLRGTLNGLGPAESQDGFLRLTYRTIVQNEATDIHISRRPQSWTQPANFQRAQRDLLRLKSYVEDRGTFLFRDMYAYAQVATLANQSLPEILSTRFPYLFLDEMQDTQRFQDDLLRQIFPLRDGKTIVQRFGDPDQAIFNSIGNEDPNETFNGKAAQEMDFVIHRSHRFDDGIAELIRGFSYNEIPLESELDEPSRLRRLRSCAGESFAHTVLVFDDNTRANVVREFASVVSQQFSQEYRRSPRFCAKAVGAVGNEIDPNVEQLKIGHYWSQYDKNRAGGGFKAKSLLDAVRHCRGNACVDWADNHKTLTASLLKFLRHAGIQDSRGRYFSGSSLRDHLEARDSWKTLREDMFALLSDSYAVTEASWDDVVTRLKAVFHAVEMPNDAVAYLAFANGDVVEPARDGLNGDALTAMPRNVIKHSDGFAIELSTIHGVKGETHDATLVMETKNYSFDLGVMLPYLLGHAPSDASPNSSLRAGANSRRANRQFMRQLYVAMSRPRHLLCLALHSDRLSDEHSRVLVDRGWRVVRLADAR